MHKLVRVTTVPLSLEKLLEGQLTFMSRHYKVTAISSDKERLEKYGKENKVDTFHVEMTREITPFSDLKALIRLYRFFKKEKPNIVHTHTPKAGILGMLAARMAGVPIRLHTVAGMPLMEAKGVKRKVLNYVEKMTYKCATKIYPNSMGLHAIILNENFTEKKKMKVLGNGSSNGIDTSYFSPERYTLEEKNKLKKSLGIPDKDLVFIFVGRLVGDKGINELVSSFADLQQMFTNISLLLVGAFEEKLDPLFPETKETIEVHPKIITTGYQQDIRPFLAVSDVLVFPSYREGFPNVVMQAGAMDLPAIVSDINGCNEIIVEGKNGILFPVKSKSALLGAMELLVIDDNYRIGLAKNARGEIYKYYERKVFWQLLLKEYKSLEAGLIKK